MVSRIMNAGVGVYVLNENLVNCIINKRSFGESGLSKNLLKMYKGELYILNQVLNNCQINKVDYFAFYTWITVKFCRRVIITSLNIIIKRR
jgi:hypothetical protein